MGRHWSKFVGLVVGVVGVAVGAGGGLAASAAASAGGWAVTTVDGFEEPVAGEEQVVALTILQHGQTPVDVDGVLLAVTAPDGTTSRFPAAGTGTTGQYEAVIELATPGRYRWHVIQGWFGEHDLGEFDVLPGDRSGWTMAPVAAPVAAVAAAGTTGLLVVRRRRHRAA